MNDTFALEETLEAIDVLFENEDAVSLEDAQCDLEHNEHTFLEIQTALESLQQRGGIDRTFALTYQHLLPAHYPLESYTRTPTQTNLEAVTVSLEWRQIAIIAGIISAVLSIIALLLALFGKDDAKPLGENESKTYQKTTDSAKESTNNASNQQPLIERFNRQKETLIRSEGFNRAWNAFSELCLYGFSEHLTPAHFQLLVRVYQFSKQLLETAKEVDKHCSALKEELELAYKSDTNPPKKTLLPIVRLFAERVIDSNTGFGSFFSLLGVEDKQENRLENGVLSPSYVYSRIRSALSSMKSTPASKEVYDPELYIDYIGGYSIRQNTGLTRLSSFGFQHSVEKSGLASGSSSIDFDLLWERKNKKAIQSIRQTLKSMQGLINKHRQAPHPRYYDEFRLIQNYIDSYAHHLIVCREINQTSRLLFNQLLEVYRLWIRMAKNP